MMCLKKKKTYESQIEKLSGANMTIQTQLMAIEGANVTLQTLDVMNMGAKIMKDLHKNMYAHSYAPLHSPPLRLFSSFIRLTQPYTPAPPLSLKNAHSHARRKLTTQQDSRRCGQDDG
jgi:Snf7